MKHRRPALRWRRLEGKWGWAAWAALLCSLALGNAYRLADDGDHLGAVALHVRAVGGLLCFYLAVWAVRQPRPVPIAFLILGAAIIGASELRMPIEDYSAAIRTDVFAIKMMTIFAAGMVIMTFDHAQLFERLNWAMLFALEAYSAVQYRICKIPAGGLLEVEQWEAWGRTLDKAACSRAFGPVAAYADVIAVVLAMIFITWRWHDARRPGPYSE